jgi:Zn-finger protein
MSSWIRPEAQELAATQAINRVRTMIDNNRFFRNTSCYYFPCHPSEEDQDFNCLFCYCPLYFISDCGGRPILRGQFKDCSNCDKPHRPGGYEHVIRRLKRYFKETQNEPKDDDWTLQGLNQHGAF